MAETRILPVRSINSSACRGTLRLSCVQGGTRLEPMLQCRKAGSVTLYAMLRRGRVTRAEADGAGFFVAASDVAGAIILIDGTIAGAAFYGIGAAERERAFTAVRMEEARRQSAQKRQGCLRITAPEEPQLSPPICPAEPTSPQEQYQPAAAQNSAEEGDAEPKSDVGRALLERANRLFTPPDANAEPFVPRPYVRDEQPAAAQKPIPPIEQQPSCRNRCRGNSRRR